MTQETAHMPLDERGLEAAHVAFGKEFGPYSGKHMVGVDAAIRAYLQTAAADVSGLVEPASMSMFSTKEAMLEHLVRERNKVASTIQTLSASNAALEAEIERLREENVKLRDAIDYYEIGCTAVGVPHPTERKVLHDCIKAARSIRAALSAPKGCQDHG